MNPLQLRKLTGSLFIAGAILVNIPYALLIANFDYPDILREPAGDVLTQFHAGGTSLVFMWLSFAWVGLPLLFAIVFLQQAMGERESSLLKVATVAGVIGCITQMIGLLRWVFVVPILARTYADPASSDASREAAVVGFQAIHQYGGVVMGEHLGQTFTILWMLLVSIAMFNSRIFRPWLAWFGLAASAVYALAQTELLATVIPEFPVVPESGLIGSLLWLGWMIAMGIVLLRAKPKISSST